MLRQRTAIVGLDSESREPVALAEVVVDDVMVERACTILEDFGYEDIGRMSREAVRNALKAALHV